jgi:hypothetical protein
LPGIKAQIGNTGMQLLNTRQRVAISLYNRVTGKSMDFTPLSYERLGRGDGILRTLSSNTDYFKTIEKTPEFRNFLNTEDVSRSFGSTYNYNNLASTPEGRRGLLYAFFKSINEGPVYK